MLQIRKGVEIPPTTMAPSIRSALPGPNAQKLMALDERYTSPSYTRGYPLAVKRADGATVEDMDGNQFLDFTAGIAVCTTGHCHPRVVEAIRRQAGELLHMCGADFYYEPLAMLAEKLATLAPVAKPARVFFTNSGAESVEAALKLARYRTGRPHIIGFFGGFHGRTMGAVSITASKVVQRERFRPLLPEISHVGYGNCYRCPYNLKYDDCRMHCVRYLEETLFQKTVSPSEVAAIVVEPMQGEGGYVVPPPEFHRDLKAVAEKHGILYIVDEVQAGMGRTGKMFAIEHWGVQPDIICLAKGLASGMPLGAIVAGEEVMNWEPSAHANTFGGNPVCCAAALETISLLEEGLVENSHAMGQILRERLTAIQHRYPVIGDVRGLGLMQAIDFVQDSQTKAPAADLRDQVVTRCFEKGLLLLGCGDGAIRFCPPLIITEQDIATATSILDAAISEVA